MADKRDNVSWRIYGGAVVLLLAGFFVAYQFVEPAPPRTLTLSTGSLEGAYHLFGERYRERLAEYGIEVVLQPSAGSLENLQRLATGASDVAFVQGGTLSDEDRSRLLGLGSLYLEPLWLFLRDDHGVRDLRDLAGQRIALGGTGSGTRAIAQQLLDDNDITDQRAILSELSGDAAAEALINGEIDAAFFVASPKSPRIDRLLHEPSLELFDFARAEGYARRYPFLSVLTLPEGAVDMVANIPPVTMQLLAPTAQLAATAELHPALVGLLLRTATEVHGEPGLFAEPGEFPSMRNSDLPLHEQARRYYAEGPPLLQRYLPFWAANAVDRMKVMLVPLLTLLIPLMKVVPPAYRWRVRARIYHWYRDLHQIEADLLEGRPDPDLSGALAALDRIEGEVAQVQVPLSYSDQLYNLRLHIQFLRQMVRNAVAGL